MRVAFPTNNLKTISNHTALSRYIAIVEIKNGEIDERIAVKNPVHELVKNSSHEREHPGGMGAGKIIPQILADYGVDVFVAREIGEGMINNLEAMGISVIVSDEKDIEKSINKIIGGLK